MKPKKYEEVTIIPNLTIQNMRKKLIIQLALIIIMGILGIYACIRGMKVAAECEALKRENQELNKVIDMKDSIIADLQEDNKGLQKLIDGGN